MKYIRKKLIITGVIMVMGLGLTGCTKTDENVDWSKVEKRIEDNRKLGEDFLMKSLDGFH